MEVSGITKIDSSWIRLAVQYNPPAIEIFNAEAIPDVSKQETVTVKIDKNAIKDTIKAGEIVPGAGLSKTTRLVMK
ncbi:MAG: siphovirus Gp157 family protein [Methylococcaceae bacterium]